MNGPTFPTPGASARRASQCSGLWILFALVAAMATVGCGGDDGETGPKTDTAAPVEKDAGTAADTTSSCKGVAQEHRRQFSQYDHQCGFLDDCAASGLCSCGKGCAADKQLCKDELCKDVEATCYCGDDCVDEPTKRPLCPEYLCKEKGKFEVKGCHALDSCTFVDSPMDAKCQCTTMADHAPTCWCGDTCDANKAPCGAAKCFGKDPNSCIVVPGEKYDNCYCATCGLKATAAACFFVLCP